jgi:WD repeat-containing protein 76
MARSQPSTAEVSDYEKQRLANIAERDALLKKLTQEAHQAGLYTRGPSKGAAANGTGPTHRRKRAAKPARTEEDNAPRRTSSRLAGLTADSEVAKRKADREYEAVREAERAKRQRISGDQELGDIVVNGKGWNANGTTLLGVDVINRSVAKRYERTFGEDEIGETTDKKLRSIRERMNGLALWDAWEPNRIKITPERIYSMSFHPTEAKPLVFAGDKLGNIGIVDASQKGPQLKDEDDDDNDEAMLEKKIKRESSRNDNPGDTDSSQSDDEDDPDPHITILKPHQRTISAMHTHPSQPQTLFTASYDSSIRGLDLEKSKSTDLYALDDEPVSGIDMAATDPHVIYFTTLNGAFGTHDIRTRGREGTDLYQLSEKKIGGFSLHPLAPHYLATASLDRTMRLWDLRKITKKLPTLVGEHTSRLSVSHAAFNSAGQVATSSYDDSIKIHSFGVRGRNEATKNPTHKLEAMSTWKAGYQLEEKRTEPEVVVRHNCQTGRWVTMCVLSLPPFPPRFSLHDLPRRELCMLMLTGFPAFDRSGSATHKTASRGFALVT